ncbi:hypothetical protein [Fimbriiglobus ruber]|uniref:hypothetical protein n=1 Tax=Fimbriiglobus ruber TaxID=1908690 RepID=UPI001EE70F6D|nr:hypothetical protein [Fimbriiglobus ruber]
MTEAKWLACHDPTKLLAFLRRRGTARGRATRRRLRLVGCACVRCAGPHLTTRGWQWVELGERLADGLLSHDEQNRLMAEQTIAWDANRPDHWADRAALCTIGSAIVNSTASAAVGAAEAIAVAAGFRAVSKVMERAETPEDPSSLGGLFEWGERAARSDARRVQAALIRDIFGTPFRGIRYSPVWRTGTMIALAEQMYESRDFSPMPILADALQAAGCDNEDILAHCRGDGPHVRGCWVVDLVLGRV